MGDWTRVTDPAALDKALTLAKGRYQRNILLGAEAWSGSTLTGKARKYGGRYAVSRASLAVALHQAGVPHGFETGKNGKIILVIGEWVPEESMDCVFDSSLLPSMPPVPRLKKYVAWKLSHFTPAGEAVLLTECRRGRRRVAVVNVENRTVRHARFGEFIRDSRVLAFAAGGTGNTIKVSDGWALDFIRAVAAAKENR